MYSEDMIETIVRMVPVIVLPLAIVWLNNKRKIFEMNKRTDIVLAAIEKNSDIDIEAFCRKMNPPRKTLKEKLLGQLFRGCVFVLGGLVLLMWDCTVGSLSLAIGIAYFIVYFVGRRTLSREMEKEETEW